MSDVIIQRRRAAAAVQRPTRSRALPIGVGLSLAAGVSLALWAGIVWALVAAF
jgi:hypothetical protein